MEQKNYLIKAKEKIKELYDFGEKYAYRKKISQNERTLYETIIIDATKLTLKAISKALPRYKKDRIELNDDEIYLIVSLIEFADHGFICDDCICDDIKTFFLRLIMPSLIIDDSKCLKWKNCYIKDSFLYFGEEIDDLNKEGDISYIAIDSIDSEILRMILNFLFLDD